MLGLGKVEEGRSKVGVEEGRSKVGVGLRGSCVDQVDPSNVETTPGTPSRAYQFCAFVAVRRAFNVWFIVSRQDPVLSVVVGQKNGSKAGNAHVHKSRK